LSSQQAGGPFRSAGGAIVWLQSAGMSDMNSGQQSHTTASGFVMGSSRTAISLCVGVLFLLCSPASFAADGDKLFAQCAACHGNKGEGNATLNAPAIAAQDAAYLERQLQNFRARRRGAHKSDAFGAQMQAAATVLADDAAVAKVAGYVAKLPKTVNTSPATGNLHNGNNLYQGKCGACHGVTAEGNPALKAPRLAGLDAAYMKRQFAHFRDGVRGTDQKDTPGRQMAMMAKTLAAERDLDDIIAYIHSLGRPK
jgi:cytochrome c553